jgi:hypothetical protein
MTRSDFRNFVRADEIAMESFAKDNCGSRIAQLWCGVARVITFFDVWSPRNFFAIETREFFRKKRARQDSNL